MKAGPVWLATLILVLFSVFQLSLFFGRKKQSEMEEPGPSFSCCLQIRAILPAACAWPKHTQKLNLDWLPSVWEESHYSINVAPYSIEMFPFRTRERSGRRVQRLAQILATKTDTEWTIGTKMKSGREELERISSDDWSACGDHFLRAASVARRGSPPTIICNCYIHRDPAIHSLDSRHVKNVLSSYIPPWIA